MSKTVDAREQAADHAADRVMRGAASPLQRDFVGRGESSRYRAKGDGHENGTLSTEVPGIVNDVVRTVGTPLDAQVRRFMEPRFGYDFSQVRVHADATSAESANAVSALAYTFGRHVVFAPGRYSPTTSEGQRLLAHELAHVVQQADGPSLQRKPDPVAEAKAREETKLDDMAREPAKAHDGWKKLTPDERDAVTERMRKRYGEKFVKEFLDVATKGKPNYGTDYYQPGVGPTREQLGARGYRLAGSEHTGNAAFDVEVWVHPSGHTVRRDISTYKFGAPGPETKPGDKSGKTPVKKPKVVDPPIVDPPIDVITTERHVQALDYLEDLHTSNSKLQALCEANPFDLKEAENAEIDWNFAREALRNYTDLDWTGVDPDFWQEVTQAADENRDLRATCCKRDPTNFWFDCGTLPSKP